MKNGLVKSNIKTSSNTPKSKVQLAFEKVLLDLEKRKEQKENLENNLNLAQRRMETELRPLQLEQTILMRKYLIRLDELAEEIGVGKVNKEWFIPYMADSLQELLNDVGLQDETIFNLYTKYSGNTINDIIEDEENIELADALSDLMGFSVDMEEFLTKGEKQFFEDNKERIAQSLKEKANIEQESTPDELPSNPKPDKEEVLLKKDARDIYMKLVKKLHPDLEQDEIQKAHKTELVKQVTDAYQKNDFFNLLKLQIEHLNQGELESEKLAEDMLNRYNKLLKKQLKGIKDWIEDIKYFEGDIIEDFFDKNMKFSPQRFSATKKRIEKDIQFKKTDLIASNKRPKTWFKEQIQHIKGEMQGVMMEEMFFNLFNGKF